MELNEAEKAALGEGQETSRSGVETPNVVPPRDSVEAWERVMRSQFRNLSRYAERNGALLRHSDMPPPIRSAEPGMEVTVYRERNKDRIWKATFPDQAGFGPAGYSTPYGYLRRMRLSNLIFGDDVAFEGVWKQPKGASIVTSQRYILPDPTSGMPTNDEIAAFLKKLGFVYDESLVGWVRPVDEVLVQDTHRGNFIKSLDGDLYAIDVQPRLPKGKNLDEVISFEQATNCD